MQSQMWYMAKRDESGLSASKSGLDGSLVPCLPFLLKTSSTEGWRSDRAVQKSTQPSSRAELSTLSRKGTVNPASLFSKGGTRSQDGKSLDQSHTTENN